MHALRRHSVRAMPCRGLFFMMGNGCLSLSIMIFILTNFIEKFVLILNFCMGMGVIGSKEFVIQLHPLYCKRAENN